MSKYGFEDLLNIMERLTAPDGCEWDRAQTHESIRINMIEEAYEAVDAIDKKDDAALIEELGDVLLQVIFHCDMARRQNRFDIADVLDALCNKLVSRHTHIFGSDKAQSAEEALGFWESAKKKEKQYTSLKDSLMRMPEGFPSLLKLEKTVRKLEKNGTEQNAEKGISNALANSDAVGLLYWAAVNAVTKGASVEAELNKRVNERIDALDG